MSHTEPTFDPSEDHCYFILTNDTQKVNPSHQLCQIHEVPPRHSMLETVWEGWIDYSMDGWSAQPLTHLC